MFGETPSMCNKEPELTESSDCWQVHAMPPFRGHCCLRSWPALCPPALTLLLVCVARCLPQDLWTYTADGDDEAGFGYMIEPIIQSNILIECLSFDPNKNGCDPTDDTTDRPCGGDTSR